MLDIYRQVGRLEDESVLAPFFWELTVQQGGELCEHVTAIQCAQSYHRLEQSVMGI